MGLQTWPPSKPPPLLSPMACLEVETPSICRGKFKSVLQLCLQQRRTREELVEQGIMPPLKTPAAFHEQIRSFERARTGNFLKHKLCSRPQRSELVRMHILQETQAEPSLQATQMKLKRARLADDLNEKISQRPGPMELVEKNILPVGSGVEKVNNGSKSECCKTPDGSDVYNFDEDSSDTLSPQHPASQQSPCSTSASPRECGRTEVTSSNLTLMQCSSPPNSQIASDSVQPVSPSEQQQATAPQPVPSTTPVLVKQSLTKLPADKSRSKKSKEPKPRVKKLKYHQYIPPHQKQEVSEVPMDSAYARLLQQQQQFLQLQILNQQQQQYNYQTVLPATFKPTTEVQTSCSTVVLSGNSASAPAQLHHAHTNRKPDHLPSNLDEMKVAELKMELKLRSLPVSGTKTDLIERLKLYQENSNVQTAAPKDTAAFLAENMTPPVSPIASKVSSLGIEDSYIADSPVRLVCDAPSLSSPHEENPTEAHKKDSEKDKRLHEKERQIEELKRKLEQEQRLVEELKMQLEVEKRSQQGDSPPLVPVQVKEENSGSPGLPVLVKKEESADQICSNQFIIGQQTITQPEALQSVLLPTAVTIQLPASGIKLHPAASGLIQTSGQVPQKIEASAALQQQCSTEPKTWRMDTTAQINTFPVNGCARGVSSNQAVSKGPAKKQPRITNPASKCKDPPRYEDAVKQTRSMLTAVQGPTAASQQMDDLFDVLIESGEISPFVRQDPPSLDKPLPVTASVTTLPINTVLSRPPPLVQVAHVPAAPLNSSTLLDVTETHKQKLMEELHSASVLNLHSTNMDGMDWLDLTLSEPAEEVNPLDMSVPVGVFSSDFLDSHELHLNWD